MTSLHESGVSQPSKARANCSWRPLYWEPVSGTGERLMIGVVYGIAGEFRATRTIRDDALEGLFGKASVGLRRLIDHALASYQSAARAVSSLDPIGVSIAGLHAGPLRNTEAASAAELLQTACLLYSSLGNLDKIDDAEESDAPQQEDVNRRFGSEVRLEVAKTSPRAHGRLRTRRRARDRGSNREIRVLLTEDGHSLYCSESCQAEHERA